MPGRISGPVWGRVGLAALLAVAAGAAAAADKPLIISHGDGITRSVEVRFADLNLDTAYGRARLDWRIEQAARTACDVHRGSDVDKLAPAIECLGKARATALAQLNARGLSLPPRSQLAAR